MIERIRGRLVCARPRCVVDVGGVGFELIIPDKDRERLGPAEPDVAFFTYLYVREDRMSLFGFLEQPDRELFLRLIDVSGVGPRLALGALSAYSAAQIAGAIQRGDRAFLVKLPGVGRRTADRLCVELSDKLADIADASAGGRAGESHAGGGGARDEVVLALTSLGMARSAAEQTFDRVQEHAAPDSTVEDLVREALRYASGS